MIRITHNEKYIVLLHIKRYPKENIKKTRIAWFQVAELIRVSLGLRRDIPVSKVVFVSFQTPHLIWSSGRIWIPNYVLEHKSENYILNSNFQVSRMHTGPEIGGCKPVVVTFEDFKDREDVLRSYLPDLVVSWCFLKRKGGMLKGSSISITEDMSR